MSTSSSPSHPTPAAPGRSDADDDELFAQLYPELRRFAAVVADADLDPDDLLQEAVARTLRGGPLHRLDAPGPYLRAAMVHLSSNHDRSRGRERRAHLRVAASLASDASTLGQPSYPSDLGDLEQLSAADRAVLYLADVERLPLAEVARILGTTAPTARTRASRARRRLARALDTRAPDDRSIDEGTTP